MIELIGLLAGGLTTLAFVPQVLKTWKSRRADDISLGMMSLFSLGVVLWIVYGMFIDSTPVVAANVVTLALALAILAMKLRFGRGG